MMRAVRFDGSPGCSRRRRWSGNSGVRFSNRGLLRASSGVMPDDRVDSQQSGVLLVASCRAGRALEVVALAQGEAAHLADRHVHVPGPGQEAGRAEEAEALVAQIEITR